MSGLSTKERLDKLEGFVGDPRVDGAEALSLSVQCSRMEETMKMMDAAYKGYVAEVNVRLTSILEELASLKEVVVANDDETKSQVLGLEEEIQVLRRMKSIECSTVSKVKVPEPKAFHGVRNAKELENFLWDMEQYFGAAHIPTQEQVSITSMYLAGDAKLWWRTRVQDEGRPRIDEWESMKKELKVQFLPCNASWLARESIRKLRHTTSVREFVKQFSSLMLDVSNMSEEDKLFNFMSGLQPWAQKELRRQGVRDLPSAMTVADGLVDFDLDQSPSNIGKSASSKSGKKFDRKEKESGKGSSSRNQPQDRNKWSSGCFICKGPHLARECPKKEQLSALIANDSSDDDSGDARLGSMKLLGAMTMVKDSSKEELMFLPIKVDGNDVLAMLDTGATSSFVAVGVAKKLGLKLVQNSGKLKAVNSEAKSVHGSAKVCLKAGDWEGECCLSAVPLDDYDLVLGIDFFKKAKVGVVPYLGGILIMDGKSPCFVKARFASQLLDRKGNQLEGDARQSMAGVKIGERSLVAALMEIKPDKMFKVPKDDNVALPPSRMKGHMMELEASAGPHAQALHPVPTEIAKQRRHSGVLLGAGCRKPSKARYGAKGLLWKQHELSDHGARPASKVMLRGNVPKRWGPNAP